MSFELDNRDENGILVGSFEQDSGEFPIDVVRKFVPFLYPCERCQELQFHVVGEQHAGIGLKIPFMRKPLVSTHKQCLAICNKCTNISTELPRDVISKLESGLIPAQFFRMYALVCGDLLPYKDGFIDKYIEMLRESMGISSVVRKKEIALVQSFLESYRPEP